MGLLANRQRHKHFAMVEAAMVSTCEEDDAIYRDLIVTFSSEFMVKDVTGRGLYQARLFACGFGVHVFTARWGKWYEEKLTATAGEIAIRDLCRPAMKPQFDRAEAEPLTVPFIRKQLDALRDESQKGPSEVGNKTAGFGQLVDQYYECVSVSVGAENLTPDVRDILDPGIVGRMYDRLRAMNALGVEML